MSDAPIAPLAVQDVRRTALQRPDGTIMTISTSTEAVMIDPATGSRVFTATTAHIVAVNGEVVTDPVITPLYACCICGRQPFTGSGVARCACGRTVCKSYCLTADRCRVCAHQPWWKRVLSWVLPLH